MLVWQLHVDQGVQLDGYELIVRNLRDLTFLILELVSNLNDLVIFVVLLGPRAQHALLHLDCFRC